MGFFWFTEKFTPKPKRGYSYVSDLNINKHFSEKYTCPCIISSLLSSYLDIHYKIILKSSQAPQIDNRKGSLCDEKRAEVPNNFAFRQVLVNSRENHTEKHLHKKLMATKITQKKSHVETSESYTIVIGI